MKRLTSLAVAFVLAAAAPAFAADDHEHAGKHGGVVVDVGHHHVEVIAKDGVLEVHVEGEDGEHESVSGATATAAVLSGGKKVDVMLTPDGEHVLKGSGEFAAGKGTVIILTLRMPDHDPKQVRVTLD